MFSSIKISLLALVFFLSGCGAIPTNVSDININKNLIEGDLPSDAKIYISLNRKKIFTANQLGKSWSLPAGELIESAAIKVFGKLFKVIFFEEYTKKAHLVVQIKGRTNLDIFLGKYSVTADAFLFMPNGKFIGRFQSKGESGGEYEFNGVAFENAYINAFNKIANQITANEKIITLFKSGFGEPQTVVVAPQTLTPASPPTPQPQQPPQAAESVYSGTGFLFSAKDYVITNWHVVRGTKNIKVKFLNGEKIEAVVALKDLQNDIAFLKA